MLLHPHSPSSVQPGLRKRGSFLSCGLGTVSTPRKVQLSHRAGLLTFPCPKKHSAAVCAALCRPPQAVSQQARAGPTWRHPQMTFLPERDSELPWSAQAHICGGGSRKWHLSHWPGMAASILALWASFGSLRQKGPQESRPHKESPQYD